MRNLFGACLIWAGISMAAHGLKWTTTGVPLTLAGAIVIFTNRTPRQEKPSTEPTKES